MSNAINYAELIRFIGSRNSVICCNLVGEECTIEYEDGRLIRAETQKYSLPLSESDSINEIPIEIACKQHIIIKGWITADTKLIKKYSKRNIKGTINLYLKSKTDVTKEEDTKTKQHIMFVANELVDIDGYYEWYDDVSEEIFKTNNNSSYCNQLNCLNDLGFEILPHVAITKAVDRTEIRLQEIIEEINQTTKMRERIADDYIVRYNDTPYVKMLKKSNNSKVKFEYAFSW